MGDLRQRRALVLFFQGKGCVPELGPEKLKLAIRHLVLMAGKGSPYRAARDKIYGICGIKSLQI